MKKYSKYFVVAMSALAFAFSTGTLLKVNATPATSAAVPAQPVDLTYAAEKSLPSVVHILSTKNSKVQTVEVESDPFSDFFSDPFGFFGNPQGNGGKQKRSVRTPKQQGSGSGVIISTDGYIVTNNHVVADADELTVVGNGSDVAFMGCEPFGSIFQASADRKGFYFRVDGFADFDVEILDQRLGSDVEIIKGKGRFLIRFACADRRSVDAL